MCYFLHPHAQIDEQFNQIVAELEKEEHEQKREKHNLWIGQENVQRAIEVSCLHI
jgi:hypothetical protein